MSVPCVEGSFPLVSGGDPDVVISGPEIQLSVNLSVLEVVEKVSNQRNWVPRFPSSLVQPSVVYTGAELARLLLNKEDRGSGRRMRRSDESLSEIFLYIVFADFKLRL